MTDGELGGNVAGQLGDGTIDNSRLTPTAVVGGLEFLSLTAGGTHTCGLTADAIAYCWGDNFFGEFGDGTVTASASPVLAAPGVRFKMLVAAGAYTCGLTLAGAAYCWGQDNVGQLGNGGHASTLTAGCRVWCPRLRLDHRRRPRCMRDDRDWRGVLLGRKYFRRRWRRNHRATPGADGRCRRAEIHRSAHGIRACLRCRRRRNGTLLGQQRSRRARRRHEHTSLHAHAGAWRAQISERVDRGLPRVRRYANRRRQCRDAQACL